MAGWPHLHIQREVAHEEGARRVVVHPRRLPPALGAGRRAVHPQVQPLKLRAAGGGPQRSSAALRPTARHTPSCAQGARAAAAAFQCALAACFALAGHCCLGPRPLLLPQLQAAAPSPCHAASHYRAPSLAPRRAPAQPSPAHLLHVVRQRRLRAAGLRKHHVRVGGGAVLLHRPRNSSCLAGHVSVRLHRQRPHAHRLHAAIPAPSRGARGWAGPLVGAPGRKWVAAAQGAAAPCYLWGQPAPASKQRLSATLAAAAGAPGGARMRARRPPCNVPHPPGDECTRHPPGKKLLERLLAHRGLQVADKHRALELLSLCCRPLSGRRLCPCLLLLPLLRGRLHVGLCCIGCCCRSRSARCFAATAAAAALPAASHCGV